MTDIILRESKSVPQAYRDIVKEEIALDFINKEFNAKREEKISNESTPADFIKEREGASGTVLEYHTEEYVIRKLNEHYPGWWMEDMKHSYNASLRTTTVTGYLCVDYPTLSGMKAKKVWAVGSERIEFKVGGTDASQPEDRDAAARTRWLKLCAKWLGIGLDIYHQRITEELREQFEDRIIHWGVYAQGIRDIAGTLESGAGMRRLIRGLHPPEVTARFLEFVKVIPPDLKTAEDVLVHHKLWTNFVKLKSNTEENIKNTESFLQKVEAIANKYKG